MSCVSNVRLGIAPPNQRNEDDFDFGSRRHVPEGVDHVRFFASHLFQFQFYKALCGAAGQYAEGDASKPLHKCSLYGTYNHKDILHLLSINEHIFQ